MNISNKEVKLALDKALDASVIKKDEKPDKIRKFDETLDLVINIRDVDIKNPNNRIEQEHLLPHPIAGNNKKVLFIAKDDMELALKDKGYPVINPDGLDALMKKSNKEKKQLVKNYTYFVARGDLMRDVARVLARFLGQQGKMPKPQPKGFGIIRPNEDLEEYLPKLERIIRVSMKKQLIIQTKIGKKSQGKKELLENIDSVLTFLEHALPNGFNNVKSVFLKTTMGKPIKLTDVGKGGK